MPVPIDHVLHGGAGIDDPFEAETLIKSLPQLSIGAAQRHSLRRFLDDGSQPRWRDRLFKKVEGTFLHRFNGNRNGGVSGDHHDFAVGQTLSRLSQ